jgi:CBS domain-containing protein
MENGQFILIDVIEKMCTEKGVCFKPLRVARDIMNTDFKTLSLDHTIGQCLKFMEGRGVRHVPVVDLPYDGGKKPYFVGIVSQRDMLRLNEPDTKETGKQKIDQRALRQLLVQIVARKPKSVSPETAIPDVILTMTKNHIDMVPVLNAKELVGVITTADIIKISARLDKVIRQLCPELKEDASSADTASESSAQTRLLSSWIFRTVQEIMTEPVVCLDAYDTLARAIDVLQSEAFRHVPVKDEQGRFIGLVSDRDILRKLPFAGKRPLSLPKKFREHLFATDSTTKNLQLSLENIMERKVLHILPSCTVHEAADMLYKEKISCLPVIDEQEKLRGIVTVTDLMSALLTAYEPAEKAGLIPSQSSTC